MALFVPSALVGAVSGQVGGVTFVAAGKGQVIKSSACTVRAYSKLQLERQAHMAWVKTQWGTLTDAQKTAWATAAALVVKTNALGQVTALTGYQAFVKAHQMRFWTPASLYTTPVVKLVGPMVSVSSAVFSVAGTYNVTVTGPGLSGAQSTIIYGATQERSKMVKKMTNWVYIGRMTNNYGTAADQKSNWYGGLKRYLRVGQVFGIKLVNANSCFWSAETEYYGTAVA